MGKAIVYCQICGQSLYEDDFERGKASRLENRPYCSKCRAPAPAAEPRPEPKPAPTPPPRRTSTDRVPVFRSAHGERPPSTTRLPKLQPRRSNPAVLWGSLLFIAVVGAVGLTLALGGGRPSTTPDPVILVEPTPLPPGPKPDPVDKDVELLRRLLAAPPADWKREEIDVLLDRRKDLEGLRKDYARGLLGLGLNEGLVGRWTLDEKDGTVARDVSGRGNDGKILGAPPRVPGRIGGAFQFRGNDEDGVEIPAANELDTLESKSFSLCAWFQPERIPPGKEDKANDAWYALMVRPGMHVGLSFDRYGRAEMGHWLDDKKQAMHPSTDTIPAGAWTHLVGIVDGAAGRTRVFVNGRPSGEASWTARRKAFRLSSPWRLGIAAPKAKEWSWSLRGLLDDVRFYARALAPDEIALLAEATALPSGAPPARTPSKDGLLLHLLGDVDVTADGAAVNAWGPTRSDGDERPSRRTGEVVFDGRDDRVVLPGLPEHAFKEADSFTLLARVRFDAAPKGRWMGVFAKSAEKAPWYGLYVDDAGRWVFGSQLNLHGSPAKAGVSTVAAIQIGGKERRLYVDGLRVATGPPMDGSGAGDLWIGGVKGKSEYLNGALQELRLWRRALDPSEVLVK